MESHPLNKAHLENRRAEAHLKNNNYDEAIQCHHTAAKLLLDVMKSISSSLALESISLQHSYHLKQIDLIKSKKEQYARVKKAMDHILMLSRDPLENLQGNEYAKLQVTMFKALNGSDNLLNTLQTESNLYDVIPNEQKLKIHQETLGQLQKYSQTLYSALEKFVLQVEVLKDENIALKEKVDYFEKERVRYLNLASSSDFIYKNNFTTLSTFEDSVEKSVPAPIAIAQTQSRAMKFPVERPNQQPHFDLSALKDDN